MPVANVSFPGRGRALVDLDVLRRSTRFAEWRDLAAGAQPLLAPELFALTVPLAPAGQALVACAERRGRLIGALPVLREGRLLTSLRSDHLPAYDFVGWPEVLEDVWRALLDDEGWDWLVLKDLPADSVLARGLPEIAERHGCRWATRPAGAHPYFELAGFEERLSAKFRTNLRRCDRKLGGTTLERVTRCSRTVLDEALALEGAAWKDVAGTSISHDAKVRHFYTAALRLFARRGQLGLAFLRAEGRRIAALLTVEDDQTVYALKIGYDPAYAALSPGHLVVWRVAEEAERRGLARLDFLGKADGWKRKWTASVHERLSLIVYRRSPRGLFSYTTREVIKPHLPDRLKEPRMILRHGCQQTCLVGQHDLSERIVGRVQSGLGIKSGLKRLLTRRPPPAFEGEPSRFAPGDWVRVLDEQALRATLDARTRTRGLELVPQQWRTCGERFRVARVVTRIKDDAGRMRPVTRTVLLEGVDCTGHGAEPEGCGRSCPLLFRDEWLEPAEAPQRGPTVAVHADHARVRSVDEIRATLDLRGQRDGLTFMAEMEAYAGTRQRILRRVDKVFELDRWTQARAALYVLEGLACTGAVLGRSGPCHRACALLWHPDWLVVEPRV